MVSGADGYALLIKDGGNIVRVNVAQLETNRSATHRHIRRTNHPQVWYLGQLIERIAGYLDFVSANLAHTNLFEVVDGGTKPHCLCDRGGACLELVRYGCPS